MELSTIKLHSIRQIGKAESQITLDDDYNVPDYRPDIVKIIREQGQLKVDEIKPALGAVWIKGRLIFRVLYRSDQENGKISCLKGELPFQEKLNIEGLSEYDPVRITGDMEDLTIGVIHSRKLNVRAVVVLRVVSEIPQVQEIVNGMENDESCMQLQRNVGVAQQLFTKQDVCRQKSEIALPSSKPNIREILWKSIELRNIGSRLDGEGIHLTGEILISVLYQEEEEPDRIQWYETTLPLDCGTDVAMENGQPDQNIFYKVQIEETGKDLEVKPDYDGEERVLVLDLQLHLYIRAWQEETIQVLEDVYSLKQCLLPNRGRINTEHLLMKNDAVCKVTEQMELDGNQERILQICACEGNARIEHTERRENGVFVEGILMVHLLYITTDDQMPVGAAYKIYPFEQLIELPQTMQPVRMEQECAIVQLSATMLDQTHAEIKAAVGVNVLAFEQEELEHITEIKEEALDLEALQQLPGLVGYIVKSGDTLWNIAKEYHTTVEAIMRTNQKKEDTLQVGEKLLIVKDL
ncbi:MAG: DUF3794 domain-containing protein [Roseburia sp.]|nr:DUF3794 domain-containing protein [Roseburia sp.]